MNELTPIGDKSPLYEKIRDRILQWIVENSAAPNSVVPSESEIARKYGVSRMTAKVALNALEKEGIIYRVAKKGSYVSEKGLDMASALVKSVKSVSSIDNPSLVGHLIAVIIPALSDFGSEIIVSIGNVLCEMGRPMILRVTHGNLDDEEDALRELSTRRDVSGIILFPVSRVYCGNELLRLKLSEYPIVIIDRTFREIAFDSVCHDHFKGAYEMTEYLVSKEHRNIGFVTVDFHTVRSRQDRYQGFVQALLVNKIALNQEHVLVLEEGCTAKVHGMTTSCKPLEEFLRKNRELTALFCEEDTLAALAYYVVTGIGISVPEDISITGFVDNRAMNFLPIGITTVRQVVPEFADAAVSLLLERIAYPHAPVRNVTISTEVVERDSVRHR